MTLLVLSAIVLFNLPLLYATEIAIEQSEIVNSGEFETDFFREFYTYEKENVETPLLKELISIVLNRNRKIVLEDVPQAKNPQNCLQCRATSNAILKFFKLNYDQESLENVAKKLCLLFKMAPGQACVGFIQLNAPALFYILKRKPYLHSEDFCNIVLQPESCGIPFKAEMNIEIDQNPPKVPEIRQEIDLDHKNVYKIIQLTDMHIDPDYLPGGNANCKQETCCRKGQGPPDRPEDAAGYWGDYRRCDSPWHGTKDAIRNSRINNADVDFVYFTGDIVDHVIWATSKENNIDIINRVYDYFKQVFGDTPVYPILGNHEAHPANLYAPLDVEDPELSTKWLYETVFEKWRYWLPHSVNETVLKGGYYTVLAKPGFRIVALNNNFCFVHNLWLLYDSYYFKEQLEWLQRTLLAAEGAGERVHILAHVPANDHWCYHSWTLPFQHIIDRFHKTITAQFNGHTHMDEFNIFYSPGLPPKAVNVAWNGGATNTFAFFNPNYKVYMVDQETLQVQDIYTMTYNLTEANLHPDRSPAWFNEYSFREFYNLPNLSPESLSALIDRFAANKDLLVKYWKMKVKNADPRIEKGCDDACLADHLCDIVLTDFHNQLKCDEVREAFLGTRREN